MSYEKDKLDSYLTSASLVTALAPYITSASVSSAIAGINLAPYVTSNSLSAAVVTDALTVRGAASVSATLSAGAVTVAGRPLGAVLLGHTANTLVNTIGFSGSWSDFWMLHLHVMQAGAPSGTPVTQVFTDGGITPIISAADGTTLGASVRVYCDARVIGGDGQAVKFLTLTAAGTADGLRAQTTATANTGFVNCVRYVMTATASVAYAALYGYRKT